MPPWSLPTGHTRNEDLRAPQEGVFAIANSSTPQVVTGQGSVADLPDTAISVSRAAAQGDLQFSSVQFSHSVVFDSLRPHESQHAGPPCPSPTPRVHSDSRP